MRTKAIFVAMLLALAPLPSVAQDFNTGLTAHERGDYAAALREFKPLAEKGNANAQYGLGVMYGQGQGVLQDYAEAARWYRLAADQGNENAQYNLGWMYSQGQGVLQDYAEAARLYRLAAEQGVAEAQYNLSLMYGQSRSFAQNYVLAHMWANIAAANGSELAVKAREVLDRILTSTDIAEAQRLARVCMESNYQDCG